MPGGPVEQLTQHLCHSAEGGEAASTASSGLYRSQGLDQNNWPNSNPVRLLTNRPASALSTCFWRYARFDLGEFFIIQSVGSLILSNCRCR